MRQRGPDTSFQPFLVDCSNGINVLGAKETNRLLRSKVRYLLCVCLGLTISTILFFGYNYVQPRPIHGPLLKLSKPRYDEAYVPQRSLDIIVSHYSENLDDLRNALSDLHAIPAVAEAKPNILVYAKNPSADRQQIASDLGLPSASQVVQLPNRGREGGTYLSHILSHWDDLAAHTLFMQGEVHNQRYFERRLADYFRPNSTGFLSLGFAGKTCTLSDCTDPWGWHDTYHHLASTYSMLYGAIAPAHQITLTYKGQFVVSARRVRGVPKHIYESLYRMLESESSPHSYRHPENHYEAIDDPTGLEWDDEVNEDHGDAPRFGYTLERMWGLLFQCADGIKAVQCPSLSARRSHEPLDTCQCLDTHDD